MPPDETHLPGRGVNPGDPYEPFPWNDGELPVWRGGLPSLPVTDEEAAAIMQRHLTDVANINQRNDDKRFLGKNFIEYNGDRIYFN